MQWTDASKQAERFRIKPSWAYGRLNPLEPLQRIHAVYEVLGDPNKKLLKRAEQAVRLMVDTKIDEKFISKLSIGIAAPLREAIRSMQLVPPSDFPPAAYKAIDREDVAASASAIPDKMSKDGYLSIKDYLVRKFLMFRYFSLLSRKFFRVVETARLSMKSPLLPRLLVVVNPR
jgi:anaphase-promoting complex subunit 1